MDDPLNHSSSPAGPQFNIMLTGIAKFPFWKMIYYIRLQIHSYVQKSNFVEWLSSKKEVIFILQNCNLGQICNFSPDYVVI